MEEVHLLADASLDEYLWIVIVGALAAFFAAYGIGANDFSKSFGGVVAACTLTMRQAVVLGAVFEFSGAVLLGGQVTATIAGGIADVQTFEQQPQVLMFGMLCAMLASGLWLLLATYWSLPVSSTHSIIGAVCGFAFVYGGPASVVWLKPTDTFPYMTGMVPIVVTWLVSPLIAGIVAALFFWTVRTAILRREASFRLTLLSMPLLLLLTTFLSLFFVLETGADNRLTWPASKCAWVSACIAAGVALIMALALPAVARAVHLDLRRNREAIAAQARSVHATHHRRSSSPSSRTPAEPSKRSSSRGYGTHSQGPGPGPDPARPSLHAATTAGSSQTGPQRDPNASRTVANAGTGIGIGIGTGTGNGNGNGNGSMARLTFHTTSSGSCSGAHRPGSGGDVGGGGGWAGRRSAGSDVIPLRDGGGGRGTGTGMLLASGAAEAQGFRRGSGPTHEGRLGPAGERSPSPGAEAFGPGPGGGGGAVSPMQQWSPRAATAATAQQWDWQAQAQAQPPLQSQDLPGPLQRAEREGEEGFLAVPESPAAGSVVEPVSFACMSQPMTQPAGPVAEMWEGGWGQGEQGQQWTAQQSPSGAQWGQQQAQWAQQHAYAGPQQAQWSGAPSNQWAQPQGHWGPQPSPWAGPSVNQWGPHQIGQVQAQWGPEQAPPQPMVPHQAPGPSPRGQPWTRHSRPSAVPEERPSAASGPGGGGGSRGSGARPVPLLSGSDHDTDGGEARGEGELDHEGGSGEEDGYDDGYDRPGRGRVQWENTFDNLKAIVLHGAQVDVHDALRTDAATQRLHAHAEVFDPGTESAFRVLQVLTAVCAAFSHGANSVSKAVGPFATIWYCYNTNRIDYNVAMPVWILVMGGAGIVVGLVTYGYNIVRAIGVRLSVITPSRGFCVELATSLVVLVASHLGLPISTTHCLVGSTAGMGLMEGTSGLNWRLMSQFFAGWVVTFLLTACLSAVLFSFFAFAPCVSEGQDIIEYEAAMISMTRMIDEVVMRANQAAALYPATWGNASAALNATLRARMAELQLFDVPERHRRTRARQHVEPAELIDFIDGAIHTYTNNSYGWSGGMRARGLALPPAQQRQP